MRGHWLNAWCRLNDGPLAQHGKVGALAGVPSMWATCNALRVVQGANNKRISCGIP